MARSERDDATPDVTPTQVVEALLFLPIGLGATLLGGAPKRLEQARSDLVAARFIGEMAVTQGAAQIRARFEERNGVTADADAPDEASDPSADEAATPADVAPDEVSDPSAEEPPPTADDLAIPDYDTVPAIDIVAQLADLDDGERDRIEVYERSHRGRRTVLGKIDQLRAGR